MKKTFTILLASAALTAAIGYPAWSALRAAENGGARGFAAVFDAQQDKLPFFLARDDHDDDDHGHGRSYGGRDDDEGECDDDDGYRGCGAAQNAAPAGTTAPPSNGLFGNGAPPPQVQVQ